MRMQKNFYFCFIFSTVNTVRLMLFFNYYWVTYEKKKRGQPRDTEEMLTEEMLNIWKLHGKNAALR